MLIRADEESMTSVSFLEVVSFHQCFELFHESHVHFVLLVLDENDGTLEVAPIGTYVEAIHPSGVDDVGIRIFHEQIHDNVLEVVVAGNFGKMKVYQAQKSGVFPSVSLELTILVTSSGLNDWSICARKVSLPSITKAKMFSQALLGWMTEKLSVQVSRSIKLQQNFNIMLTDQYTEIQNLIQLSKMQSQRCQLDTVFGCESFSTKGLLFKIIQPQLPTHIAKHLENERIREFEQMLSRHICTKLFFTGGLEQFLAQGTTTILTQLQNLLHEYFHFINEILSYIQEKVRNEQAQNTPQSHLLSPKLTSDSSYQTYNQRMPAKDLQQSQSLKTTQFLEQITMFPLPLVKSSEQKKSSESPIQIKSREANTKAEKILDDQIGELKGSIYQMAHYQADNFLKRLYETAIIKVDIILEGIQKRAITFTDEQFP